MTLQDAAPVITGVGVMFTLIWNIYQATVGRQKADHEQDARITALEVKVGLFWHSVEENMADLLAKSNPIHLEPAEQISAHIYRQEKSKTPTPHLIKLDQAISREVPNLSADERAAFTLIQSAIRAQLVDRHEYPYDS